MYGRDNTEQKVPFFIIVSLKKWKVMGWQKIH